MYHICLLSSPRAVMSETKRAKSPFHRYARRLISLTLIIQLPIKHIPLSTCDRYLVRKIVTRHRLLTSLPGDLFTSAGRRNTALIGVSEPSLRSLQCRSAYRPQPHLVLSTSSASSFDLVSRPLRSRTTSSDPFSDDLASDDEIVWSISESPHSSSNDSSLTASDDDFVALSRPRSPFTRYSRSNVGVLGRNSDALVGELAKLSINPATSSTNDDMRTPIGKPSNISIPLSEGGRRKQRLDPNTIIYRLGSK